MINNVYFVSVFPNVSYSGGKHRICPFTNKDPAFISVEPPKSHLPVETTAFPKYKFAIIIIYYTKFLT